MFSWAEGHPAVDCQSAFRFFRTRTLRSNAKSGALANSQAFTRRVMHAWGEWCICSLTATTTIQPESQPPGSPPSPQSNGTAIMKL